MAKLKSRKEKMNALNQLGKISHENLLEVQSSNLNSGALKNENVEKKVENREKDHVVEATSSVAENPTEMVNVEERTDKSTRIEKENKNQSSEVENQNLHKEVEGEKKQVVTEKIDGVEVGDKPIQEIDISLLDNAPEDWNRFPMLSEDRRAQLKLSIESSGLFNPILVWKQENGRYMILSGHNRVAIYKELYQDALDEKYNGSYEEGTDDIARYSKISCIVYEVEELNAKKAREIIIDTNFIQRGELPARLRAEILEARADIYKDQRNKKGKNIKEIAEELGIKKTAIYEDFQIIEKVVEPYRKQFYEGKLGRKAVLKLPLISLDLQQKIYEKHGLKIDEKQLFALKKNMTEEEVWEIFEKEENVIDKQVRLKVPSDRESEFKLFHKYFIEQKDPELIEMVRNYLKKKA